MTVDEVVTSALGEESLCWHSAGLAYIPSTGSVPGQGPARGRGVGRGRAVRGAARTVAGRAPVPDPGPGTGVVGGVDRDEPVADDPADSVVPGGVACPGGAGGDVEPGHPGLLVVDLVGAQDTPGTSLLIAALQVWATNVIAFGLIYWELDRGGPVARTQKPREELPLADFRFTQDETQDTVIEVAAGSSKKADWIPTFVDYLYLSTTNSSAFSPTDTMPLTSRAKILMAVQATAALITSLLVIARAVGALGGGG